MNTDKNSSGQVFEAQTLSHEASSKLESYADGWGPVNVESFCSASSQSAASQRIAQPETPLFKKILELSGGMHNQGNGKYLCNCFLPNHPAKRKKTFFYYDSTDSFTCFACSPNSETLNGKKCFSGGLKELNLKMQEVIIEPEPITIKEDKLPRSNSIIKYDLKLLSALLLSPGLNVEQVKAIQLLLVTALGRKVSDNEINKVVENLIVGK